jgi:hypothetical protein
MSNASLLRAKDVKYDEFYTPLDVIESELHHYKDQLKDKVVFCNCDDPFESYFFKYFAMNFNHLGLKKLITTSYSPSPIAYTQLTLFGDSSPQKIHRTKRNPAYKIELDHVEDMDGSGSIDLKDVKKMLDTEYQKMKGGGEIQIIIPSQRKRKFSQRRMY